MQLSNGSVRPRCVRVDSSGSRTPTRTVNDEVSVVGTERHLRFVSRFFEVYHVRRYLRTRCAISGRTPSRNAFFAALWPAVIPDQCDALDWVNSPTLFSGINVAASYFQ